jgi:hypothetical protein
VAGDMADIATVAKGLQQGNPKKENSGLALAALAAVTLLDIACHRTERREGRPEDRRNRLQQT